MIIIKWFHSVEPLAINHKSEKKLTFQYKNLEEWIISIF